MNIDKNTMMIIAAAVVVLLLMSGSKDDAKPTPSVTEAVAAKAIREFAGVMADAAEEAAGKEPNAAAKSLAAKVVPGFDRSLKPVNELIDQAIESGDFPATMRGIAKGYRSIE